CRGSLMTAIVTRRRVAENVQCFRRRLRVALAVGRRRPVPYSPVRGGNRALQLIATPWSFAMPRYESPYDPSTMPKKLEHVIYEKKGHIAYVTINRPEVRNALHSYTYAELRSCWRDIGLDPDIYVGIVTGAGESFCAGRDVKFLAS